jgi:hypothetical protein
MRRNRVLLLALSLSTAACTALLGTFDVGPGGEGADGGNDGGPSIDGSGGGTDAGSDAALDGPSDAHPDAPVDAGPPAPDGGFLSVITFGSTNTSPPGNMRTAFDKNGNLFILFGYTYANNDVFGTQMTPVGSVDMGLVKVTPAGGKVWARSYGSASQEYPGGLAVDDNGDVYISGATEGTTIDFGGTTSALTRRSNRYLGWIVKIDGANGDPIKAIGIDGFGTHQGALCQALVARGTNIAALCGTYGQTVWPLLPSGNDTNFVTPDGVSSSMGFVVASLDTGLAAHWVNALGTDVNDFGQDLALAPNGDVVVAANTLYATPANNLTDTSGTVSLALGSAYTAYVARFAAASGGVQWVRPISGDASNYANFGGIDVDATGRILVVGNLTGSVDMGSGKTVTSNGQTDLLLAAFSGADGTTIDAKRQGGAGLEQISAIAVDKWGALAMTGSYRSTSMAIDGKGLPDPLASATSGFVYRAGPDLGAYWTGGFTTALAGTLLQAWSVATDPVTGRIAAAGVYKGVINFGNGTPVKSSLDGGGYDVWVVQRVP